VTDADHPASDQPGPPPARDEEETPDTPMTQLVERGGRIIAVLLAILLVLPAGAWLIDTIAFNREGAQVADAVPELADAVALVTRLGCNGGASTGSGFAIEYEGGPALVTNRHVVLGAASIGLRTLDGGPGPEVTQVLVAPDEDVAVLVLSEGLGSSLGLGPAPQSGDAVRLVGFPGARPITTEGTVQDVATGRVLLGFEVGPGASGAPVVDHDGTVVAQVVARRSDGSGVAIPAPAVAAGIAAVVPAPEC